MNFTENKLTENKQKRVYYVYDKDIQLAIDWLIKKVEKIDKPITTREQFIIDIRNFIKKSNEQLETSALICTSETFFAKKMGNDSLKLIFKRHNIDFKGYIVSINITRKGVFVTDGFGAGRRKIESIN